MVGDHDHADDASLLHSFAFASMLVIAGVVGSGFLLTNQENVTPVDLPVLPILSWLNSTSASGGEESWIDLANVAFASGRVTEPVSDNALYYYHQAVMVNADDNRALEGLNEVVAFVIGDAEKAIYTSDWAQARRSVGHVLAIMPDNEAAISALARTEKFERIDELERVAVNQLATDRLLSPGGDNALNTYEQIQQLDPDSPQAAVGIQTIAQRLVAKSQAAALAGKYTSSSKYLKQARKIAPEMAALDGAAKLTDQFAKLTREKAAQVSLAAETAAVAAAVEETVAVRLEEDRVYSISELVLINNTPPVFPRRAELTDREGWVELNFRVDPEGEVYAAEIVRSSDTLFELAALQAIRKWRFEPHLELGVAVAVRSGIRFAFRQ